MEPITEAPVVEISTDGNGKGRLPAVPSPPAILGQGAGAAFHYNIQIHLPTTTDVTVYNAIFKSLRDNLL